MPNCPRSVQAIIGGDPCIATPEEFALVWQANQFSMGKKLAFAICYLACKIKGGMDYETVTVQDPRCFEDANGEPVWRYTEVQKLNGAEVSATPKFMLADGTITDTAPTGLVEVDCVDKPETRCPVDLCCGGC